MYHHKKMLSFLLSAGIALCNITPVMAAQTAAMIKEKGDCHAVYSFNKSSETIYTGEAAEDADYIGGIYILDENGQIHLATDADHIYAGGVAPDGQFYDSDGNRLNALEYVRKKYYPVFAKAAGNTVIRFKNATHQKLFQYWYTLHYASDQGVSLSYYIYEDGTRGMTRSEFDRVPTNFGEAWKTSVSEDAAQIDKSADFKEQLTKAIELTANRFIYDASYTTVEVNQALADGKGVCFHFARYLYDVLNAAGIENDFLIGSINYANDISNMHVWNTATDPETGKMYYTDASNLINGKALLDDSWITLTVYSPVGVVSNYITKDT